jgi:hypothetical protein
MDQGSPGLPINAYGVAAEKRALDSGIGSQYPAAAGVPELKEAASRFVKAFIDVDITPRSCVPTTGSVAGSFGSFIACTQRIPGKDKVLFIDPGFPIQKSQLRSALKGIQFPIVVQVKQFVQSEHITFPPYPYIRYSRFRSRTEGICLRRIPCSRSLSCILSLYTSRPSGS